MVPGSDGVVCCVIATKHFGLSGLILSFRSCVSGFFLAFPLTDAQSQLCSTFGLLIFSYLKQSIV